MIWAISAVGLLIGPALYRAWLGWRDGATVEMRTVIVTVFGVLLALRFWEPGTTLIAKNVPTADPRYVAMIVFLVLGIAGASLAALAVKLKGYPFHSPERNVLDQVLGVIVGFFGGALLGGSLAMLMVIALPSRYGAEDTPEFALKPGTVPVMFCRQIEEWVGIEPTSPDRTRFASVGFREEELAAGDRAPDAAPGTRLVKLMPVLIWR